MAGSLCQGKDAGVLHADFERKLGRRLEPPWRERKEERKVGEIAGGCAAAVGRRTWGEGACGGHYASCHLTNPQIMGKSTLSISAFDVGILFIWGTGTGLRTVRGRAGMAYEAHSHADDMIS